MKLAVDLPAPVFEALRSWCASQDRPLSMREGICVCIEGLVGKVKLVEPEIKFKPVVVSNLVAASTQAVKPQTDEFDQRTIVPDAQ